MNIVNMYTNTFFLPLVFQEYFHSPSLLAFFPALSRPLTSQSERFQIPCIISFFAGHLDSSSPFVFSSCSLLRGFLEK